MAKIETNEMKPLLRSKYAHCCNAMQYFCRQKATLVDTLRISPRVIIYKEQMKIFKTYETLVTIEDDGLHSRRLTYATDSEDTTVDLHQDQVECLCSKKFQFKILVKPKMKLNINRRRHVFIKSEHPNIIFSLPIIILGKREEKPSFPDIIKFPSCCVNGFTFYEMIFYNGTTEKLKFDLKCKNPEMTIILCEPVLPKRNFIKILLKLNVKSCIDLHDVIKVKIGVDWYEIPFEHQTTDWSLYLDNLQVDFDPVKFYRLATKSISICNESSKNSVRFYIKLSKAEANQANERIIIKDSVNKLEPKISEDSEYQSTLNLHSEPSKHCIYIDEFAWKHFDFQPKCGTLAPNSSISIKITFKPIMHSDFNPVQSPPYTVLARLMVGTENIPYDEEKFVAISGIINGTEIEINPQIVEIQNVYFGEEHCTHIEVINTDTVVDCHVDFYDYESHDDANVIVTPKEGLDLKPCAKGLFILQFFSKKVGKLLVKLRFKLRRGGFFFNTIRGYFQHVRVKCFPDIIDMATIPICVPQIRLVLVMNPLTVPITVQCMVPEDGTETPLVLNIIDVDEHLPIDVKDHSYYMRKCMLAEEEIETEEVETETSTYRKDSKGNIISNDYYELKTNNEEESLLSFRSVSEDNSSCSTDFLDALDSITDIAPNLVNLLKKVKIFDKLDLEKKVIEEVMNALLKIPYFKDMDKNKNYCHMDWNALPSDPKELYCNNEIIYLSPNTGKAICVVVIPNVIGNYHRSFEIRACPVSPPDNDDSDSELKEMAESKDLTSKLWIDYKCAVPEVLWDNVIDMQDALYCGELYDFVMIFENCSKIGGFFYYEAIPDNEYGSMRFLSERWKYFIEPAAIERVPCAVEFKKTGFITLIGLIKFVGITAGFPFHIKSEVLPARISYSPKQIVKKMRVLEKQIFYVFIDNATPTTTWLSLILKDDSNVFVYPQGGQLSNKGQGMYATISAFYRDPGIYRYFLYLKLQYEFVEKIPITLQVEGMPIFFEPEIRISGLCMGYVLCTTEDDYLYEKPCFTKAIRIINKGERHYRIQITRTKCLAKPTCTFIHNKTRVQVTPNFLTLEPKSEDYILISAYACEERSMYSEFRVDIIDGTEPKRKNTSRFVVTAELIYPELSWSRREIIMDYHRTHVFKEFHKWETLNLYNVANNLVESVRLKVSGPFLLKDKFEGRYVKELNFSMNGLECKELFLMFDKRVINKHPNALNEGRVTCWANKKNQKFVTLKVRMFVPTICIPNQEVVLFAKKCEGLTYIRLENPGPVLAIYKWRKLKEEWHYISEEDDSRNLAETILSDLLHTLQLEPCLNNFGESETNLTERYKKYRCLQCKINDPINVRGFIYEIIDNLDLMHKRYQLTVDPLSSASSSETDDNGSEYSELNNIETIQNLVPKNTYIMKMRNVSSKDIEDRIEKAMQLFDEEEDNQAMEQVYIIQKHFNSTTLYFNRKFRVDGSESENIPSTSEHCVYHTLDYVLSHLKLDDSFTVSEASSEPCDAQRTIYFLTKCGVLEADEIEMCALHLPAVRRGYEVTALFQLEIVGGKTVQFQITCVNLDKALMVSKQSVYLGMKPWYETFKANVKAKNVTKYGLNLKLKTIPRKPDKLPKLAAGSIRIQNDKSLYLPAHHRIWIQTEGTMGFCNEFIRDITITVNDGEELNLRLRGYGIIPLLNVENDKLPFVQRDALKIMQEYRLLQKIYYFEIFKAFTECDVETTALAEENDIEKTLSMIFELSYDSSSSTSATNVTGSMTSMKSNRSTARHDREMRFLRLLQTYELVINNQELPNATILNQIIETERFLNLLRQNDQICSLLNLVHQEYLKHKQDDELKANLKFFTIQPLPFELRGVQWDLGKIVLDEYQTFKLILEFFGPGKLIASVRSAANIPGLIVVFQVAENTNKDFIYYRSEPKLTQAEKPYRNMTERQEDADADPKLKHAHSFDINKKLQHVRDISRKDRKWLLDNYSSLNKSVYIDRKSHFIHCKIYTKSKHNSSGKKISINLLIKPQTGLYKEGQKIEDYLYVDLHMGPTLPILLLGTIVEKLDEIQASTEY